jgi:hypothetical protein
VANEAAIHVKGELKAVVLDIKEKRCRRTGSEMYVII